MFLANIMNNIWNNLPRDVVNTDNLTDLKNETDKYLIKYTHLFD